MISPSTSQNNREPNYAILTISLEDAGFSIAALVPRTIIKNLMSTFKKEPFGAFEMLPGNTLLSSFKRHTSVSNSEWQREV